MIPFPTVCVCPKCKRWLRKTNMGSQSKSKHLFCSTCKIHYKNPYYDPDNTPLWKREENNKITKKGLVYQLRMVKNGNYVILFHNYNWYLPTEEQIFLTKDEEIIEIYKKIDSENYHKEEY